MYHAVHSSTNLYCIGLVTNAALAYCRAHGWHFGGRDGSFFSDVCRRWVQKIWRKVDQSGRRFVCLFFVKSKPGTNRQITDKYSFKRW